jgi:hypothetical protein
MAKDIVVLLVTLLAYGCPVQAIMMAFGLDERTVLSWQNRSGRYCQQVHEHLVEQPRDLGQVQADEIRVKMQDFVWMASVQLPFHVPPQPGQPLRRRGRPSNATKALIAHWCTYHD